MSCDPGLSASAGVLPITADFLLGLRDGSTKKRLQRGHLRDLAELRTTHPDLCDVTFEVGRDDAERRQISAHSLLLAIRSPYFRSMLYGPLRQPDRSKVINDMPPEVFERVLDWIYVRDGCLDLGEWSLEELFHVRYAADQFQVSDLFELCNRFIMREMTYERALEGWHLAIGFRADGIMDKIKKVIKNRHRQILTSDSLKELTLDDLVELIELYRSGVKADFVIRAIQIWGSRDGTTAEQFRRDFRETLYKHVAWDNLSNSGMIELHATGTLPLEMENQAMLAILARPHPLPADDKETICSIELRLAGPEVGGGAGISRLLIRTARSIPNSLAFTDRSSDGPYSPDADGVRMLKGVLASRPLPKIAVDSRDVKVQVSVDRDDRQTIDLHSVFAYSIRVDNRDVHFIELSFAPITFADPTSDDGMEENQWPISRDIYFEVRFAPELFKDLIDGVLVADYFSEPLTSEAFLAGLNSLNKPSVETVAFSTKVNGKRVFDKSDSVPKYFYEQGDIPIVSMVEFL